MCLTALTISLLCWSVLSCCVWQWLKPCLSQVEIKAATDAGSAASSVKSLLTLLRPLYSSVQVLLDAGVLSLRSYSIYFCIFRTN